MHAFFIISYNRKYHNIEWLKLSFSRFAHHLSKSRVLICSPSIVERARNLSTWDDGVICIKICKLMGVSLQTVFVSQPLSADEDWTRTKKTVVQSSFSSNYHSWNINYCPCNIRFNCNSNTNMTNVSNWSISNALSFSYKKTSKVYKIIQLIFFSVVFSLNLCVWILPYLHSI